MSDLSIKSYKQEYTCESFSDADKIGKAIGTLGVTDVTVKRYAKSDYGDFRVKFTANWMLEKELLDQDLLGTFAFRSGAKWSDGEYHAVLFRYLQWEEVEAVASYFGRTRTAICSALGKLNWYDEIIHTEQLESLVSEKTEEERFFLCCQLARGEISPEYADDLLNFGIGSNQVNPGSRTFSFVDLLPDELDSVYKILMFCKEWEWAVELAILLGDTLKGFRIARQFNRPELAYRILDSVEGLPPPYSGQKFKLWKMLLDDLLNKFPKEVEAWSEYDSQPIDSFDEWRLPPSRYILSKLIASANGQASKELSALAAWNDIDELTKLHDAGNKTATAVLSNALIRLGSPREPDQRRRIWALRRSGKWPKGVSVQKQLAELVQRIQ